MATLGVSPSKATPMLLIVVLGNFGAHLCILGLFAKLKTGQVRSGGESSYFRV